MKSEDISPETPAVIMSPYEGISTDIIRQRSGDGYAVAVRDADGYLIGSIAGMTEDQLRLLGSQIASEVGAAVYLSAEQVRDVIRQNRSTESRSRS